MLHVCTIMSHNQAHEEAMHTAIRLTHLALLTT